MQYELKSIKNENGVGHCSESFSVTIFITSLFSANSLCGICKIIPKILPKLPRFFLKAQQPASTANPTKAALI